MKVDSLLKNLMQWHGPLPNTLLNLANSNKGVCVLGAKYPDMEGNLPPKDITSPLKVDDYKVNKLLRDLDCSSKKLLFNGHSSNSEFYVFNSKLRMFLGSDCAFYSIAELNELCVYSSLKNANLALSNYDSDVLGTFKIYEKIYTAFLNEYNVDVQLTKTITDSSDVIESGEETPLYRTLYILESLIEESYIPIYEISRLHNEEVYRKVKGFDNRATRTLPTDEANEYTEYLKQVFVQQSPDQRPITLGEYMKNSIW